MQLAEVQEETSRPTDFPESQRAGVRSLWLNERVRSILVIVLVVVLANSTYLLHVFNPNPINQLSGLGTIAHAGPLAGQNNIDPNIGFTAQALGHRAAVDWLHGQIPWWNPYEGVGAPLAGEMQAAAFFPLDVFNLLPNGQIYFRLILEVLAGVGTYLLLRRFTRSNMPAVVGGIAFALNGTFSWLFHAPGNPIAFLPFLLLGVEWAREGAIDHRRKGWAIIALALALSLYAGFPEVAFIDGLLAVLWCAVRVGGLPRRSLVTYAQSVALGAVVGVLIAAPIMVAFADYFRNADIGGHGGGFANAFLSGTTALPAQVLPYVFGPIFGFSAKNPAQLTRFWDSIGGYFGAALCVLALIGVVGRRYRALRIALAVWIVVGLARLVGVGWALDIINAIPGVKSTAFYRYAPPSWELAMVVLAALGLDDVINRLTPRRVIISAGVVMVGIGWLCWRAAQPVFHALVGEPHNRAWALMSLAWALTVVVGVVVLCSLPQFRGSSRMNGFVRGALAAVVVLDMIAMFVTPQFSAPRQASIDSKPVTYLEQHLGQSRFFTLGPLAPDYGSYFGLGSVAVNDVPIPKSYQGYVLSHLDPNVDPLEFTGTTMLDPSGPTSAQEFVDRLKAYEAVGVKYVLIPSGMVLPSHAGPALRQVFSDATTRILELPHSAPLFGSIGGACSVHPVNVTAVGVDCGRPSKIVYRELYMPGWHAEANGLQLKVSRNGPIFQSVNVPAGRSTVEFGFTPPHTTLALAAFILGIALLALASPWLRGIRVPISRRRRGEDHPTP
jgi:hypothetical protein